MSLLLDAEQEEFRRSLSKFVEQEISNSYVRKRIDENNPSDPILWEKLLALGLFQYFDGASSASFRELSILAHEVGKGIIPEPLIDALFFGPYLALILGEAYPLKEETREAVMLGKIRCCGRFRKDQKIIRSLPGAKFLVDISEDHSIGWYEVQDGSIDLISTLDNSIRCGEITGKLHQAVSVDSVSLPLMAVLQSGYRTLLSCEMAGAAEKGIEITIPYLQTRKQFGVPVGSFQAVQHSMANAYLSLESLKAMNNFASWSLCFSPEQAPMASRSALLETTELAPSILETCLQLHGGIGFTWEHDLHLFLRRAKMLAGYGRLDEDGYREILQEAGKLIRAES